MEHYPVQYSRHGRLQELCRQWGIVGRPLPSPLMKPDQPRSYMTDNDEFYSEELLKKQRSADVGGNGSNRPLSRAFTTKKKTWEYKEIYSALYAHISSQGSPGVAEALILKLNLAGGNLNLAQRSRTSLLSRKKSLDLGERSQILQLAVSNGHIEMVEVLLPHADALSLDTALPIAIRNQNEPIIELLIRYGASVAQTTDGQDALRQACAVGSQPGLIALLLSSESRPSAPWLSQCMVDAARAGCLETVLQLSQTTADSNFDNGAALKAAVGLGRKDIALVLALGTNPPVQPGLNQAFEQLMGHQNINPNEKMAMSEILLCAGAQGDLVAHSLVQAAAASFFDMVHLLVSCGASIEFQDAYALKRAVAAGKVDLVQALLGGKSTLGSSYASQCVELIPKTLSRDEKYSMFYMFLRSGASGPPLDQALVNAVESDDADLVRLLVASTFPSAQQAGGQTTPNGTKLASHETASTDFKDGMALKLAIKKQNVMIANLILANKPPSHKTLYQLFPIVCSLPSTERYQITEGFLRAGLSGAPVNSALDDAIAQAPPNRDENLIALFLQYHADVNFNNGQSIITAVQQTDMRLLNRLLQSKPRAEIVARAVPLAMQNSNESLRLQMITMLLGAGASLGGPEVSTVTSSLVQVAPVDKRLLKIFLQSGDADINDNQSAIVVNAVSNPDPEVLEIVLKLGKPTTKSLELGLKGVGDLSSSAAKNQKLNALLGRMESRDGVTRLLVAEVQALLKSSPGERNLSSLTTLLANGADVNFDNGDAIRRAVAGTDMNIVDAILAAKPSPNSLSFAMPEALRMRDPQDRLRFAQKVLEGGIPASEVNRALVFAVQSYPDDTPLINALLSRADTQDGMVLIEAIKRERQDIVELVLDKKRFSQDILNSGFMEATRGKNKRTRSISCSNLLKAGASGEVVSDALLAAASDGDLDFGTILVQNGGSVEHKDGQAIIEACRSGSADILRMLLAGGNKPTQTTLQKGFQAATEVGNLGQRAEVFKELFKMGVTGDIVHSQLVSAGRYGDGGEELVRLLLANGASPDYNDGEVIEKATRSAFMGSLEMLLGIAETGGSQKKPSSHSLVRAMESCWDLNRDNRFTILEWVFKAGKPVPSAVHSTLTRAVNEEEPEERLIQLLINNRASPVVNGCQTLIDATRTLTPAAFEQLIESKVTPEDASLAFSKVYIPDSTGSWLSEHGCQIARCLLEKGAKGEAVSSALVVVVQNYYANSGELADEFIDLFLKFGADVNFNHGEIVQAAAEKCNPTLLERFLKQKPNKEALTLAFPKIFDTCTSEDDVHELIALMVDYGDGDSHMDVMFTFPGSEPVLVRALSQFPRSVKVLQVLLDIGFYYDQVTNWRVMDAVDEDEQVTLLTWALLQPQKKISSGVLNLLIERGANVNVETKISRVTPLMVAIQSKRTDIVKMILLAGAEVDITDAAGNSPLSMATAMGGDMAITMMSNLLAAGASRNDGSLHNAARELNLPAMQVLIEYQHDPDFPSPLHGGRSALGELCRHAADSGEITAMREKTLEKAINFLLLSDSDISVKSEGKSILLLALESQDPVTTTKVLLRANMWKFINKPFNQFTDDKYTYSPTMYAQRLLPESDHKAQLVTLLRANRCNDVFYSHVGGAQPDDAVGLPPHLEIEEQERRARAARLQTETEDHARAIQRSKELAAVQAQIWEHQSELEDARKRRAHDAEMSATKDRARAEEEMFQAAIRQQRQKQSADMQHQEAITRMSLNRQQTVADAELANETQRRERMLTWERELGNERVGNANQLSSIRLREREETERMEKAADGRFRDRMKEQKKLVDSQTALAANLGGGSGGGGPSRRQIGFISGELT